MSKGVKGEGVLAQESLYLLCDNEGVEEVRGGPFGLHDDEALYEAIVESMEEHPFDLSYHYRMLIIGRTGIPEIDEFDASYIDDAQEDAWDGLEDETHEIYLLDPIDPLEP